MAASKTAHADVLAPSALVDTARGNLVDIRDHREVQHRRRSSDRMVVRPRCILVLGTGNVLQTDGGVGACAISSLRTMFEFPESVVLIRDWDLCLGLLDAVMEADAVVVIDAVRTGSRPGTLHRLTGDCLRQTLAGSDLPHQARLGETLVLADILGRLPETVMVGIEPEDTTGWSTRLTETVERRIPDLVTAALCEIERMGGEHTPKCAKTQPALACSLASA